MCDLYFNKGLLKEWMNKQKSSPPHTKGRGTDVPHSQERSSLGSLAVFARFHPQLPLAPCMSPSGHLFKVYYEVHGINEMGLKYKLTNRKIKPDVKFCSRTGVAFFFYLKCLNSNE